MTERIALWKRFPFCCYFIIPILLVQSSLQLSSFNGFQFPYLFEQYVYNFICTEEQYYLSLLITTQHQHKSVAWYCATHFLESLGIVN